jgi:hypothetical protein
MTDRALTLSAMIANLKTEIKSAQTDDDTMFELGDITIKTKVAIKARGKAGAKASFYVVTAELGGGVDSENSHEVTIVLRPHHGILMGNKDR